MSTQNPAQNDKQLHNYIKSVLFSNMSPICFSFNLTSLSNFYELPILKTILLNANIVLVPFEECA